MKKNYVKLNILGFYQILGGLLGCIISGWIFISLISIQPPQDILFYTILSSISFFLFIYSIVCGFLLLKKQNIIKALKFSLINQVLQLVNFSIFGFAFKYISGFYLSTGFDLSNNSFIFKWGVSSWEILMNSNSTINEVNINIFALVLILLIDKLIKFFASFTEEDKIEGFK